MTLFKITHPRNLDNTIRSPLFTFKLRGANVWCNKWGLILLTVWSASMRKSGVGAVWWGSSPIGWAVCTCARLYRWSKKMNDRLRKIIHGWARFGWSQPDSIARGGCIFGDQMGSFWMITTRLNSTKWSHFRWSSGSIFDWHKHQIEEFKSTQNSWHNSNKLV